MIDKYRSQKSNFWSELHSNHAVWPPQKAIDCPQAPSYALLLLIRRLQGKAYKRRPDTVKLAHPSVRTVMVGTGTMTTTRVEHLVIRVLAARVRQVTVKEMSVTDRGWLALVRTKTGTIKTPTAGQD